MRFRKGEHYPHPPRGPGRRRYDMSDAARRARRRNLSKSRLRSDQESLIIKLLIWQSYFDGAPLSQRVLARQLGVWPSYICKVLKQVALGLDVLPSGRRVTLDDLQKARGLAPKIGERGPSPLASSIRCSQPGKPRELSDDDIIAKNRSEVAEWKRKHLYSGRGWFRW